MRTNTYAGKFWWVCGLAIAGAATACGSSHKGVATGGYSAKSAASSSESSAPADEAPRQEEVVALGRAPAEAPAAAGAPSPMKKSANPSAEARGQEAPSAAERPGLGTEWGETRYSHV